MRDDISMGSSLHWDVEFPVCRRFWQPVQDIMTAKKTMTARGWIACIKPLQYEGKKAEFGKIDRPCGECSQRRSGKWHLNI